MIVFDVHYWCSPNSDIWKLLLKLQNLLNLLVCTGVHSTGIIAPSSRLTDETETCSYALYAAKFKLYFMNASIWDIYMLEHVHIFWLLIILSFQFVFFSSYFCYQKWKSLHWYGRSSGTADTHVFFLIPLCQQISNVVWNLQT